MKTTKQISAVFLSTLMLSSCFLDCGDILSINKCEAIVRRVVVRKRVVKKPAENINTQQSSSNNSNTYSNTDNYNPDSNTGGNPNNYNTNDNATSNTSSNANNNANNNASSNTGIGDSNRDTRWNIVGGNEPEDKKTDTNANNQLRTEDLNLTNNIRLGLVTDKESVAQRYVDVYADSALTRKYSNRWIDKGENYSVIQEYGNTLYVQYYSSSGEKRTGYVSNLIRTAQENTTEKILKGDVNGDGKVTLTDLSLMKAFTIDNLPSGSTFIKENADINGDGKVSLTDLSLLKEIILNTDNDRKNYNTEPLIEPVSRYKQLPDGWYSIKSVNAPSKGLDVYQGNTSNGSNIILYDYNGQDNQKFYLKNQGDGTFTLKAGNCDLYLDAANGSSSNSTNIQLYQGNGTNAQKWKLVDANNNQFYIESNLRTKLSFDCANGGSENGTNIQLWDRGNVAWNKWIFSMVEGPVKIIPTTNNTSVIVGAEYEAMRSTDIYDQPSLSKNSKRKNAWISKGERYIVLQDCGESLFIKYYNSQKNERNGYVHKKITTKVPDGFVWPVDGRGEDRYNWIKYNNDLADYHHGTDIRANEGTKIFSSCNGIIRAKGYDKYGLGKRVSVVCNIYGTDVWINYGHMSEFASGLNEGDTVVAGQLIGYVGSTGNSSGNHLHYEVREGKMYGEDCDPHDYLP